MRSTPESGLRGGLTDRIRRARSRESVARGVSRELHPRRVRHDGDDDWTLGEGARQGPCYREGMEQRLPTIARIALGGFGAAFVAMAIALALVKPDGAIVVGFLAAGLLLALLALIGRLPSEVGIGGGVVKFPEALVEREYGTVLTERIRQLLRDEMNRRVAAGGPPLMGGGIGATEADRESALRLAREATSDAELIRALDVARQAADEQAFAIEQLISQGMPPRGIG